MAKSRLEKALAGITGAAVTELPAVTSADEGKALIVNSSGAWAKGDIPAELPAASAADSGRVLMVDGSGNYVLADLPE